MLARTAVRAVQRSSRAVVAVRGADTRTRLSWARFASSEAATSVPGVAAALPVVSGDENAAPPLVDADAGMFSRAMDLAERASDSFASVLAASPDVEVIKRTTAPIFEGSGFVPTLAQLLESVHETTGQPWWVVIVGSVVLVRAIAIPLSIKGMAAGSRLRSVNPFMSLYRKQQMDAAKRQDQQAMMAATEQITKLQKQYGASPLAIFAPMVFQLVAGIWVFATLRRMGLEADQIEGFVTEGLPWVPDLGTTEYTLPAIVMVAGLLSAELSYKLQPPGQNAMITPEGMRNFSRFFAVFGGAIMTTLPAAVTLSAAVTALSAAVHLGMVQLPFVQRAFGFAKGWPDVEYVVPPGWDAESAARLALEHEESQAKSNPLTKMLGQSDAPPRTAEGEAASPIKFAGLKQPQAPPPPASAPAPAGDKERSGVSLNADTFTTPTGQVLYKAKGDKPTRGAAKGRAGGNKGAKRSGGR
ncbi:hypothetical protein FNF27_02584 [Cafeteria roenbergensis]|uniref:Membrane insertase YidC/Oxa/ALB C-terminal domain-containing protein n=1 Tax=Cafeteria roenbergensis TaxID=33653 RepID=A0A5A8EDA5_CAFRO|nr:hypothetical protein FNF29_06680 [Cafeteria roenbergensis]KAA0175863.1 hypothetical protein FNF27_02584 [Cafeteria roenbergensis]|eukprot:KAA0148463.1 hypothetical protein FNF29_06680 [Cafeteria roenbergensis]